MIERLISFATPEGDGYGAVAIEAGGAACAYLTLAGDSLALDDATATPGEGSLRVAAGARTLFAGLAAQTSPIGFEAGGGLEAQVQAVSVSGEIDRGDGGPGAGLEAVGVAWKLTGAETTAALRTLWASAGDRLLVGFATRPQGASDHAAEQHGFASIRGDGSVAAYPEPLLSTTYDAAGAHTRATLELWSEAEGAPADRGAGTRAAGGSARLGAGSLAAARFEWRLDGAPARGGYEIFSA